MKIQGGGKMAKKVKKDFVDTTHGKVGVYSTGTKVEIVKDEPKKKSVVVKDKVEPKTVTNVYNPNFSTIDDTIEDIKKESRKQGVDHYSCNNIYIILQDALKKVKLAGK